jgi:hypothetical protein
MSEFLDRYGNFKRLIEEGKETGLGREDVSLFFENIDKYIDEYKYWTYSLLLKITKKEGLFQEYFEALLSVIDKFSDYYYKCIGFFELIVLDFHNSVKATGLLVKYYSQIEAHFLILLSSIHKYYEAQGRYELYKDSAFFKLLRVANITGLLEEYLLKLLECLDTMRLGHRYPAFNDLMIWIKGTELINQHYNQIESRFLALLNDIDKNYGGKYKAFYLLIYAIKTTPLLDRTRVQIGVKFLSLLNKRTEFRSRSSALFNLLKVAKIMGLKDEQWKPIWSKIPEGELKDTDVDIALRELKSVMEQFLVD